MTLPARWQGAVTSACVALALVALSGGAGRAASSPYTSTASTSFKPGGIASGRLIESEATPADEGSLRLQASYVGRDAIEPTVGVTPSGAAFMTASWYDSIVVGRPRTVVMRSTDGGSTWTSASPTIAGVDRTTLPPSSDDPYLHVDRDTGRVFSIDLQAAACSHLSWSDDDGETWERNPLACGQPLNDHQTLTTGPPPPGLITKGYRNVVYYCMNHFVGAGCSRSLDGGVTFDPVAQPFPLPGDGGCLAGAHGHAATDADGRLFIPRAGCDQTPEIAVSDDGGDSWRVIRVHDMKSAYIHTEVAADSAGNLYYVWWDPEHRRPWMSISTDHGTTWARPHMVAPPGVAEVNFPTIAADGVGRVAITYPGTTVADRDDHTRPWNAYFVVSTDALARNPTFIAATANPLSDPIHRGECQGSCGWMMDFLDIQVAPSTGEFWATFVDTCTQENACNSTAAPGAAPDGSDGVATDAEAIVVRELSSASGTLVGLPTSVARPPTAD